MSRDDDLVGLVLVDGVLDRLQRVGIDDGPARCDAGLVEKVERAPQAALGARAAAVGVDDEARARLVLRGDDRDADRAFGGALPQGVDQNLAGDRLVGDDEDVAAARCSMDLPRLGLVLRRGRRS